MHPQSHLHAALFTLDSPWPNLIHTWTLSPPVLTFACTLQHLRCLCKRARRAAIPLRLARTSLTNREHSRSKANHGTRSQARASKGNSWNSRPCLRAASAPYDKSLFFFCNHFGFSSSRFDICTLALPFTFSLLIPGPTHSQRPPFVIRSLVLLYMACLYSRTHRLALSLSYLICSYLAVFPLVRISTLTPPACSAPLEAWQGSAHAKDAWPRPKPCSNFSAFARSLTRSLPTQNLRWRLREPCMELSRASDTLASTRLCGMSLRSHNSPYGSLHLRPSALLWTNDRPGGTGHDSFFLFFFFFLRGGEEDGERVSEYHFSRNRRHGLIMLNSRRLVLRLTVRQNWLCWSTIITCHVRWS